MTVTIYFEHSKIFISPRFIFVNDLPTLLFKQIKENLITEKKFEFFVVGKENHQLNKLLHQIVYIGLLYSCVKHSHRREYLKADLLIRQVLDSLNNLYKSEDKSVNLGDVDFLKIEALLYFIQAKNLHKLGNFLLLEKNQVKESREAFSEAGDILLERGKILKKLRLKEISDIESVYDIFDHSYIYAIGLIAKEHNKEKAEQILKSIKKEIKSNKNILLAEAVLAQRLNNNKVAKIKLKNALKLDPNNKYALRRISSIYFFKQDRIRSSYKFLKQLHKKFYFSILSNINNFK